MKRTAGDRTAQHPKPVKRIELSGNHLSRKWILLAAALILLAGTVVYAVISMLRTETGWTQIEEDPGETVTNGNRFTLQAEIGVSGRDPAAEKKELTMLWSEKIRELYQLFHPTQVFGVVRNLAYINQHPGEDLTVDKRLYDLLRKVDAGGRWLYLGPVLDTARALWLSEDDTEAANYDPRMDSGTGEWLREVMQYISDPAHISLAFPAENTVRLDVSETYSAFMKENGLTAYLDAGLFQDAYTLDLIAEDLSKRGCRAALLSSRTGFAVCLDNRDREYEVPMYTLVKGSSVPAQKGTVRYAGPASLAVMNGPVMAAEKGRDGYRYADGTVRTPFLSDRDGLDYAGTDILLTFLPEACRCMDLALAAIPVLTEETPDQEKLAALAKQGIDYVCLANGRMWQDAISIRDISWQE